MDKLEPTTGMGIREKGRDFKNEIYWVSQVLVSLKRGKPCVTRSNPAGADENPQCQKWHSIKKMRWVARCIKLMNSHKLFQKSISPFMQISNDPVSFDDKSCRKIFILLTKNGDSGGPFTRWRGKLNIILTFWVKQSLGQWPRESKKGECVLW